MHGHELKDSPRTEMDIHVTEALARDAKSRGGEEPASSGREESGAMCCFNMLEPKSEIAQKGRQGSNDFPSFEPFFNGF